MFRKWLFVFLAGAEKHLTKSNAVINVSDQFLQPSKVQSLSCFSKHFQAWHPSVQVGNLNCMTREFLPRPQEGSCVPNSLSAEQAPSPVGLAFQLAFKEKGEVQGIV